MIFFSKPMLFLIFSYCSLALFAGKSEVVVFDNGKANIYIDIPASTVSKYELDRPLADFSKYFEQMTGKILPQTQAVGLMPISFLPETDFVGSPLDARRHQGYTIDVSGKGIIIKAFTGLGCRNAIYHILDSWGCRWVMFDTIGEVIPEHNRLTLPVGIIDSPKCFDTSVQGIMESQVKTKTISPEVFTWWKRNQGGHEYGITGRHNWIQAIPSEVYFKDHPEWYSLIAGKRRPEQLCTSNPEVITKMIEAAKKYLEASPARKSFPLDPEDSAFFCQCPNCKALDPPDRGADGSLLATNRVVNFGNAVARGIKDEFPDRYVAFYAYSNHMEPPTHEKLEKNICIIICRSNHCGLHLAPASKCPSSIEFYNLIERWQRLTDNLYVYEYDPNPWSGGLPFPTYLNRAEAYRTMFRDYGIKGGYTDYSPHFIENNAGTYLNQYIERRVKANPSKTGEEILKDMCMAFFGPASEEMDAYYTELANVIEYTHPGKQMLEWGLNGYWKMFKPESVIKARAFLNKAKVIATSEPYKTRVHYVDLSQKYLEAYLDGCWNANEGSYDAAVKGFDNAVIAIENLGKVHMINSDDAKQHLDTARKKELAANFPDRLGFITTFKLCGPFDNSSISADWEETVPPSLSSIPVVNGKEMKWELYHSPEGMLNLSKYFSEKKSPWKLSWVYAGVKIIAPYDCRIDLRTDSFYPYVIFFNGGKIDHKRGLTLDSPGRRWKPINLKKGENELMFKLCQNDHVRDWGVYVQFETPWGEPITLGQQSSADIKLSIEPRDWVPDTFRADSSNESMECGLKFSIQKAGKITALRFYQAKGESGAHTLRLWDIAGKLLQTVDAPEAKGQGWINVVLPKPFMVNSGETFVVSYTSNTHHPYAIDFFRKPIIRGGITGIAGVYSKIAGNIPDKSYNFSNYFIDIVYE